MQPLKIGSSASLEIGSAVAAIGDPFDHERSIGTGIVSGLDRTIEAPNGFTVAHSIQTDAALNPGNSGGPLLDSEGRVVGVVDQIATGSSVDRSSGVGFAVPSDLVASELATLKRGERVRHAYLGAGTATASGATAGAVVQQVVSGGPGADAGGDVVTAADGDAIAGADDLVGAITAHTPGETMKLTIRRGSDTRRVTVTLRSPRSSRRWTEPAQRRAPSPTPPRARSATSARCWTEPAQRRAPWRR